MKPATNHCPLPKSAVWRFLSFLFYRNTVLPKHLFLPPFPTQAPVELSPARQRCLVEELRSEGMVIQEVA